MSEDTGFPPQSQGRMPADEHRMDPAPDYEPRHPGVGKLRGKVALITGGDSGIGRAVAVLFAREGAHVAIAYLDEDRDAEETRALVEREGAEALLIPGDLGRKDHCLEVARKVIDKWSRIDILVNNAAQQWMGAPFEEFDEAHLRRIVDSNVMGPFFMTQAALPHIPEGGAIINTTSVNAFKGNGGLVAYSTTRGASLAFTRSMAEQLADKGIRVNAVAPGPIWTPFIPGSFPPPTRWPSLGRTHPWVGPDSRGRWRPAICSLRPRMAVTCMARPCTPMAARSSVRDRRLSA